MMMNRSLERVRYKQWLMISHSVFVVDYAATLEHVVGVKDPLVMVLENGADALPLWMAHAPRDL